MFTIKMNASFNFIFWTFFLLLSIFSHIFLDNKWLFYTYNLRSKSTWHYIDVELTYLNLNI